MHHSEMKVEMTRIRCRATNDHKLYITHLLCLLGKADPKSRVSGSSCSSPPPHNCYQLPDCVELDY